VTQVVPTLFLQLFTCFVAMLCSAAAAMIRNQLPFHFIRLKKIQKFKNSSIHKV
jgi:hypothetical protein